MPIEPWIDGFPDDHLFDNIRTDENSFKLLFNRYFPVLTSWCQYKYSFDPDLAKEATHTSFIKLWENRHNISADLPVRSYLYKILSNTCIDIIRHQNVRRRYEKLIWQRADESEFSKDLEMSNLKDLQQEIDMAVNNLPEKMRQIFELSRYEGLKYNQIANKLGISIKTVETQMSRALVKIREKLRRFYGIIFFLDIIAIFFFNSL